MWNGTNRPWLVWGAVSCLVCIHFFLGFSSLRTKSPTADEYSYVASSYFYTKDWDFRLDRTHPPLLRLLTGLPLLPLEIHFPPLHEELWDTPEGNMQGYRIGWEMLLDGRNDPQQLLTRARMPVLFMSCALALVLFAWSKRLYGVTGGFITLFLYCFCPNMLAHARLATMDLGVSLFMILTLYCLYLAVDKKSVRWWGATGLTLGLALASKVTAVVMLPVVFFFMLRQPVQKTGKEYMVDWKSLLSISAAAILSTAFALCVVYGYPIKPFYYWETLQNVLLKSTQTGGGEIYTPGMPHTNYAFYLFGKYSTSGWFYYSFAAMLVKTPIPVFLILLLVMCFTKKLWRGWEDGIIIGAIVAIVLASMANRVNIGLRHILPFYPLLYLYLGRASELCHAGWKRWTLVTVLAWLLTANAYIYPDYLAYFNEAAGGPKNSYRLLDDSNIDWGQDLGRLAEVKKQYPNEDLYIATNWMFNPKAYGFEAALLKNEQIAQPPKGIVAVGIHWAIRHRIYERSPDYFDWFEKYESIGQVGHSIRLYRFE